MKLMDYEENERSTERYSLRLYISSMSDSRDVQLHIFPITCTPSLLHKVGILEKNIDMQEACSKPEITALLYRATTSLRCK